METPSILSKFIPYDLCSRQILGKVSRKNSAVIVCPEFPPEFPFLVFEALSRANPAAAARISLQEFLSLLARGP
jgi:hypothetical protein